MSAYRWTGWQIGVCEYCLELLFESDGGWAERLHHLYHLPCFFKARRANKLPKLEVPSEKPKAAKA